MLFELAHVVWPPLRTANCTCLQLESSTSNFITWLTCSVDSGCTIQEGDKCVLSDQYELVRRRYCSSSRNRTWPISALFKISHCNPHHQSSQLTQAPLPTPSAVKPHPKILKWLSAAAAQAKVERMLLRCPLSLRERV